MVTTMGRHIVFCYLTGCLLAVAVGRTSHAAGECVPVEARYAEAKKAREEAERALERTNTILEKAQDNILELKKRLREKGTWDHGELLMWAEVSRQLRKAQELVNTREKDLLNKIEAELHLAESLLQCRVGTGN